MPAVIGLGLYAQTKNLNLSNNTTILLELLAVLSQQNELVTMQREIVRLEQTLYGAAWPYYEGYGIPYRNSNGCLYTTEYSVPFTRFNTCAI
jgi:hypothetical protein